MSNMQDVPLAEQEEVPAVDSDGSKSKSNTLKRLLKIGKKLSSHNAVVADAIESTSAEPGEDTAESDGDAKKSNTISRILTRFKGAPKSDAEQASTSVSLAPDDEAKASQHTKLSLKGSLSTYWRNIFKRSQAVKKNQAAEEKQSDETEQQIEEAGAALNVSTSGTVTRKLAEERNIIPEILEEVQMVPMSEDVELGQPATDGAN